MLVNQLRVALWCNTGHTVTSEFAGAMVHVVWCGIVGMLPCLRPGPYCNWTYPRACAYAYTLRVVCICVRMYACVHIQCHAKHRHLLISLAVPDCWSPSAPSVSCVQVVGEGRCPHPGQLVADRDRRRHDLPHVGPLVQARARMRHPALLRCLPRHA